jgi:phage tail sheath protein FI
MPQYLAPGVYIEEVAGARPIEGVGTATGAFVGIAEKGPIGLATLVSNWTQFTDTFGGYIPNGYLAYAVNHFFNEGGTSCYVVRTCHYGNISDPTSKRATTATVTIPDRSPGAAPATLRVDGLTDGDWGNDLGLLIANASSASSNKFKLTVLNRAVEVEIYDELDLATAVEQINARSKYIRVSDQRSTTASPGNLPKLSATTFNDAAQTPSPALDITALAPALTVDITNDPAANTFGITVKRAGATLATFSNLKPDDAERKINGLNRFITVRRRSGNLPAVAASVGLIYHGLTGGWDGLVGTPVLDADGAITLEISTWRDAVTAAVGTTGSDRFSITVKFRDAQVEKFDGLTKDAVERTVNGASDYVNVRNRTDSAKLPVATTADILIVGGLEDADFIGDEAAKNGLHAFDVVDDINIVAVPDRPGDRETILAGYTYCQNRGDCFFVADPPMSLSPLQALAFKQGTGDFAGNAFNTSYGALYYPWIQVSDPRTGGVRLTPPSGAIAGTYSYTDVARGVHKAPAGINEGYLNSAVGIERLVTKGEQGLLNPAGINLIRSFAASGITVWGARTLSADAQWKYVNVRRLLLFIEESIDKGTQWVVFEPNDPSLWAKVKRDVSAFLTVVWQSGALFGTTDKEAFFVKVDRENNPPESVDLGRLVIDVGVAPVKPAEFVIFRITQMAQGAKG